ncbi:MAG: helix-turn-helix domain-containing protein [Aquincola sp.]|nr:helix-turn-helix domain-containing protein [Aquincola sp.]
MPRRSLRAFRPAHSRRFVVPLKSKKLNPSEVAAFEAKRDLGAEILQSIQDMKAGKGKVVVSSATEAREATGLSQSQFASLLGVSVRTLQGWEQGRKQPSGAARTLLAIARTNPKAVLAVSAK